MRIGVTDNRLRNMEYYFRWLCSTGEECDLVTLSQSDSNPAAIADCHGLVLTGGGDVDPSLYESSGMPGQPEDVDAERDRFETALIMKAIEMEIPILAICRGMQLFNVIMGGSLIVDLESAGYREHRKGKAGDRRHQVTVEPGTLLHAIAGSAEGVVNTNHHQAVDRPGNGLRISALSDDGVVEGLEWEQPAGRPFLQLVQWHPERMEDSHNPMSTGLLRAFLRDVRQEFTRQQASGTVNQNLNAE